MYSQNNGNLSAVFCAIGALERYEYAETGSAGAGRVNMAATK